VVADAFDIKLRHWGGLQTVKVVGQPADETKKGAEGMVEKKLQADI